MDEFNPYGFYGMGGSSDPFNYYATPDYSTNFAPPTASPYGDTMVGERNPQASYYSPNPTWPPAGEQNAYSRSMSQVPGTSGAPNETPSSTPGGVSSGAGTGYSGTPYGNLYGGAPQTQRPGLPKSAMTMAQLGMKMMAPPQQQQNPQVQRQAQLWGVDYATALKLMQMQQGGVPQMQYGGYPQAGQPVIVGERGPELFVPNLPGTIVPQPRANPLMHSLGLGADIQRRRFGLPPQPMMRR